MKKYLLNIIFIAALINFAACSDDDTEGKLVIEPIITTEGAYILNEYNSMNGENSKLSYYDKKTGKITKDVFNAQNDIPLGVGAQDILIYGSKMYISVTKSENIYITDLNAKLLKYDDGSIAKIKSDEVAKDLSQPRSLIAHDGYVYASYYSGHVAKIDTTSMKVVATVADDYKYLEGMTIVGNKLYVAETRDQNDRLAVINLDNFKLEAPITVAANPYHITSDHIGNIYTLSVVYDANWVATSTFSQIKSNGEQNKQVYNASEMSLLSNKLLLLGITYNQDYSQTAHFSYYDIYTNKIVDKPFVTVTDEQDKKQLNFAYKLAVDPTNNDIYVSTSEFGVEGIMYVFDKTGTLKSKFQTGGLAPNKIAFIVTEK